MQTQAHTTFSAVHECSPFFSFLCNKKKNSTAKDNTEISIYQIAIQQNLNGVD